MWATLILQAIQNIVIPEVTRVIADHHAQTGVILTAEQVNAMLRADVMRVIASGQAFLDATAPKPQE